VAQAHAGPYAGDRIADFRAAAVDIIRQLDFLGRIELVELGEGAPQRDLVIRRVYQVGVDQIDGYEPARPDLVLVPDDQMRDRPGARVEDRAADLAAVAVRAAYPGP
jgi:hypothetical protein